jgi:hypothetical protein
VLDFFLTSISIGSIVFLIQKTDFVCEYLKLFLFSTKNNHLIEKLKIKSYENSNVSNSYIEYLAAVYGTENNKRGFFLRLISCFLCLSCFISFWLNIFFGKILFIFPMFFVAVIVYLILNFAMQKIYSE